MRHPTLLALCVTVLALGACQTEDPYGRSAAEIRAEEKECLAAGGRFDRGGLSGALTCFRPTSDAGKTCRATPECEGMCLAEGSEDNPPKTGQCASERPMFGCIGFLDETGDYGVICID